MKIEYFKMERMQSEWEFHVDYNLSESGVYPLTFEELVSPDELDEIKKSSLGYLQTNGTEGLRERISQIYPGTDIENILVTTGSAEANFLLMWKSLEPGDEVLILLPNYMQMWGLMKSFGAAVKPFFLKESLGWNPDPDELKHLVTGKTKLFAVTNPNNPTGAQLSQEIRQTIVELADSVGAWIFSDEVYQGAELDGQITASLWGTYDRMIVTSGLSKAYGLPGLRTGWMVGPADFIQEIWPYHDYTTISLSAVSDRLARIALEPKNRKKILNRTRRILNANYDVLDAWFKRQDGVFENIPPKAGAIVFPRYNLEINSTEFIDKLRKEHSVLLVPGDHFEMDGHIRFGFGEKEGYLRKALQRVESAINDLKKGL
jgi:aspartate/methionine/tyrosine aminotransferase